jgi:hypothetical protein
MKVNRWIPAFTGMTGRKVGMTVWLRILSLALIFSASNLVAQELGELAFTEIPEGEGILYIVRNEEVAVLVVHSTIPVLSFECNMGIIKVDNPDPGEYRIHLYPGANIVTFKAEKYLPLKHRFYIEKKNYKEIKIFPKAKAVFSENQPEITLAYTPAPGERVVGSIDNDVMNLNFASGSVILKPVPGKHTVRLNSNGRIWSQDFNLKEGDKIRLEVKFPEKPTESAVIEQSGSLFLQSEPIGANVYMNKTLQGQTPLTLDKVTPGQYIVELSKPYYLPQQISIQIKSLEYAKPEIVKLIPNFGSLKIDTQPIGAVVYIDGKQKGTTPFSLMQIDVGKYALKLSRQLYNDEQEIIEIKPGLEVKKSYELKPQFGKLSLASNPPGALVTFDGQDWGATPVVRDTVISGKHTIRLNKELYSEYEEQITIADGQILNKLVDLSGNFATIIINPTPTNAQIKIKDSKGISKNYSEKEIRLLPDAYSVILEAEGYVSFETILMLAKGAEEVLEPKLIRKTGNLQISSDPQGADIYIEGVLQGKTPTILKDFPTGTYKLRLDKSGHDLFESQVTVNYIQTTAVTQNLSTLGTEKWLKKRNKARMLAVVLPGAGNIVSGQTVRGVIYSGAFVFSAYMIFDSKSRWQKCKDDYDYALELYYTAYTAPDAVYWYNQSRYYFDQMESKQKDSNLFWSMTLGTYTIQLLDAWIWGGGKRPVAGQDRPLNIDDYMPKFKIDGGISKIEWTFDF